MDIKIVKIQHVFLIVAACFALGSVGFFLAVLVEGGAAQKSNSGIAQIPIVEQQKKDAAMESLSASEQSTSSTATQASSESGQASVSTSSKVSSVQAAPNDQQAAAKLKVLDSLNAQ